MQRGELWVSNATDGAVAIYHDDQGTWMHDADIPTGADAHAIVFTADGLTAYVTNQGAGTVSVINVATRARIKDIAVGRKPNGIVLRE
jgi:YVTN family beta-propeller protein